MKNSSQTTTNKSSADSNVTPDKIFIGVSWPYASGNIHLGHLAGQYVVCDVFARYHRLKGNQVLMVSGSDSHGAPVIFAAEEQGLTPEELATKSHNQIVETYKKLGFLYENYTSTHTENHKIVSQNIFLVLEKLGFLKIQSSKQYYDPKAERFLPDRYVRGTCPHCKATNARGDECPECGEMLDPTDLIDPYSTISDAKPILKETQHYYIDLARTEPVLKEWLKDKTHWRKWVKEFTEGWLRGGLRPRAVTRDLSFGIPVPVKGWESKVLYVWIEAVVGYLSAAIEWAQKQGDPSKWEDFWKDPACKHYYFIAGGNVPFHTIIWPAEIIGYNGKYEQDELWEQYRLPGETKRAPLGLPYDVPANNMLTYRGRKMSKGDKTGIGLDPLLETYGSDVLRYFFARFAPETDKRELAWKDFIDANNNELVANIGNFINRVLSFTYTRFEGTVPKGSLESEVKTQIDEAFHKIGGHIEKAEFVRAIEAFLEFGHFANKYFNDQKPWETLKTDPSQAGQTMYNALQIVSAMRILMKPFLPFSAEKLGLLLNVEETFDANKELEQSGKVTRFADTWKFAEIHEDVRIIQPDILFNKFDYSEDLQKADNPDIEKIIVKTDFPYSFDHMDEGIVIAQVAQVFTDNSKRLVAKISDHKQFTVVCGDESLQVGDIVPLALPGSTVKSSKGDRTKIKESKVQGYMSEGMLCSPFELQVGEDALRVFRLPHEFNSFLGKPLKSIRPIWFHKDIQRKDIPTGWLVSEHIAVKRNRPQKLDDWIKESIEIVRKKYSEQAQKWNDHEMFTSVRELHRKYSKEDTAGSAESLIETILQKGSLPNINSVVDFYNMYSALTGVSIGAHDIEKLEGQPKLVILEKDTPFTHATTEKQDTAKKGEYAYTDDKGILCRLDVKQGSRTQVTKDTNHILFLFQGNSEINETQLQSYIEEFSELMKKLL